MNPHGRLCEVDVRRLPLLFAVTDIDDENDPHHQRQIVAVATDDLHHHTPGVAAIGLRHRTLGVTVIGLIVLETAVYRHINHNSFLALDFYDTLHM